MNSELTHYGILGMKWGIRRFQNSDGSRTAEGRKREAMKKIKDQRIKDKKYRSLMSDEELFRKLGRLEKEKKFRELTQQEVAPGRTAASKILKDIGRTAVVTVGVGASVYTVRAVLQKKFDPKELARALTPKK